MKTLDILIYLLFSHLVFFILKNFILTKKGDNYENKCINHEI